MTADAGQPTSGGKRLAVYSDTIGGYGGNEYCAAALVRAAASRYDQIDLFHHWAGADREVWSRVLGEPLPPSVHVHWRERERGVHNPFVVPQATIARWWQPFTWRADRSRGYDAFISIGHDVPPYCHARRGVYYIAFPLARPFEHWPLDLPAGWSPKTLVQRQLARQYWLGRFRTYRRGFGNSRFTADWIRQRWQAEVEVLYPPPRSVPSTGDAPKESLILSVGRFGRVGVDKRALEMVRAFTSSELPSRGVRLAIAGGLSQLPEEVAYFDDVAATASGYPVDLYPNVDNDTLNGLFTRASIYWHAVGLGVDVASTPELVEHFGLTVVEAMSAGCVPVVIAVGGPAEIVRDGQDGVHCRSSDDLVTRTAELFEHPQQIAVMAESARARSRTYSESVFVNTLLDSLE